MSHPDRGDKTLSLAKWNFYVACPISRPFSDWSIFLTTLGAVHKYFVSEQPLTCLVWFLSSPEHHIHVPLPQAVPADHHGPGPWGGRVRPRLARQLPHPLQHGRPRRHLPRGPLRGGLQPVSSTNLCEDFTIRERTALRSVLGTASPTRQIFVCFVRSRLQCNTAQHCDEKNKGIKNNLSCTLTLKS